MSVWDTFIGLAATALKERPRQQVLLGLLELREAMIACQRTYNDYQAVLKEGDYDTVMEKRGNLPRPDGIKYAFLYNPRDSWRETVEYLAVVLTEVDDILNIFSPETGKHVRYYGRTEAMSGWDDRDDATTDPMDTLNAADAGIDLNEVTLSSQFEIALGKLDEFIRQNFKLEEVFAMQKKVHPWPDPFRFCGEYWYTLE
jgi:hypothetical protein